MTFRISRDPPEMIPETDETGGECQRLKPDNIHEDFRTVLAPATIRTSPGMVNAGDFRSQPGSNPELFDKNIYLIWDIIS